MLRTVPSGVGLYRVMMTLVCVRAIRNQMRVSQVVKTFVCLKVTNVSVCIQVFIVSFLSQVIKMFGVPRSPTCLCVSNSSSCCY